MPVDTGATAALAMGRPFAYLRPMIAIALALSLAAADAADAPVTAYAQCLADQARALDDGKSDAETVARIVRINCAPAERVAALALAGDADNFGSVVAGIEAGGLGRAVRAVLRVRTAAR